MGPLLGGTLTLIAGALLAGCFSPTAPACVLLCDGDDTCPAGLACSAAGLCAPQGESCAAGDLADSGTGTCGELAALADDFDDGVIDEGRWSHYSELGATLREEGGQLVFEMAAGAAEGQAAGVVSQASFPLADFDVSARVLYADQAAALSLQLHAQGGDGTAALVANPGSLKMLRENGGGSQESNTVSWDPAAQPWWRARQAQGELVFAVSTDGESWERSGAVDATSLGERVFVELSGFADTAAEAPRVIGFDQIGPVCP